MKRGLIVVLLLIGRGAHAAMSLEDCVHLAEAAPSAVSSAARQTLIERARFEQSRAALLPRISAFGGYTRNGSATDAATFVSLNGTNQYTALVAATEEIDLSGRLRAARARAAADGEAASIGERVSRRELRRAVAVAYHRLLLARRLITVSQETLAEAQRFATRTALLSKKGEAARADIVKAEAQVVALRQALRAAELDAALANHELASFWTEDVGKPLEVIDVLDDEPLPVPPPGDAWASVARRPELALLDARFRSLSEGMRGARAARYPQGNLVVEYGIDSTRLSWRERGYAVLLTLNVPIFDWSFAAKSALQLSLQGEQIQIERQMAHRAYARDYQGAWARVVSLRDQIAGAVLQVQLSEENLKLSRLRYEGGEGSALEVVSAQNQLAQARTNHLNVLAGHLQARVDLSLASAP